MSLAEAQSSSPSSSSGSDDFAALLASELELASGADSAFPGDPSSASPVTDDEGEEEDEDPEELEVEAIERNGNKRRRVEEQCQDQGALVRPDKSPTGASKNVQVEACPHSGYIRGLCYGCGKSQDKEDVSGVPFGYIDKGLRLSTSEIDRLRGAYLKNLSRERKLVLILDLDHTLIHSTKLHDISSAEKDLGIQTAASKDDPNRSIFVVESMQMLTKLRPFVRQFLKEARNMFEMYIYTMGDEAYAIEIAKLLDPSNIYFPSKVISNSDCTQRHQKGLDMILGAESVAVILDDTESVWQKHKENLILMEGYHFFASSCRQFGFGVTSLSESMRDERESDGALATILDVLKRIHAVFFNMAVETDLSSRDVRQVIKAVRKEILQGCKIVFSRVFPNNTCPQEQMVWKMAENLGAVCSTDVDSSVTHVVTVDLGTEKARWGVDNKKFLVHPHWIEAANFRWHRQPEEDFPVTDPKEKRAERKIMPWLARRKRKDKETAAASQKEMRNGEGNVAGQEKDDDAKKNAVDKNTHKEGAEDSNKMTSVREGKQVRQHGWSAPPKNFKRRSESTFMKDAQKANKNDQQTAGEDRVYIPENFEESGSEDDSFTLRLQQITGGSSKPDDQGQSSNPTWFMNQQILRPISEDQLVTEKILKNVEITSDVEKSNEDEGMKHNPTTSPEVFIPDDNIISTQESITAEDESEMQHSATPLVCTDKEKEKQSNAAAECVKMTNHLLKNQANDVPAKGVTQEMHPIRSEKG